MKDAKLASAEELLVDMINWQDANSFLIIGTSFDGYIIIKSQNGWHSGRGKTLKKALINFQLNIFHKLFQGKAFFPNPNCNWKNLEWRFVYENWLLEDP